MERKKRKRRQRYNSKDRFKSSISRPTFIQSLMCIAIKFIILLNTMYLTFNLFGITVKIQHKIKIEHIGIVLHITYATYLFHVFINNVLFILC